MARPAATYRAERRNEQRRQPGGIRYWRVEGISMHGETAQRAGRIESIQRRIDEARARRAAHAAMFRAAEDHVATAPR